jgi:hypothetical protein
MTQRGTGFRWLAALGAFGTVMALAGCATVPPPVEQHRGQAVFERLGTVGLRVELPDAPGLTLFDGERGGGGGMGLLQQGIVLAMTSRLADHVKSLSLGELRAIEDELAGLLERKGLPVRRLSAAEVTLDKLPRHPAPDGQVAARDFRPLKAQLGLQRLLVVSLPQVGVNYPFGGFVPMATGDPMAWVAGEAYMVDLQSNQYLWYRKVRVLRGAGKDWDQPPSWPALSTRWFEVVEIAKDQTLEHLARD